MLLHSVVSLCRWLSSYGSFPVAGAAITLIIPPVAVFNAPPFAVVVGRQLFIHKLKLNEIRFLKRLTRYSAVATLILIPSP